MKVDRRPNPEYRDSKGFESLTETGFEQSGSHFRIKEPYQSLGAKGSFVPMEPKARDHVSIFNKLVWFPKNSVIMGRAGFFKSINQSLNKEE